MNVSFNKKNHNVFARFRHSQDREIHLGYTIKDAISRMEAVIKERKLKCQISHGQHQKAHRAEYRKT